MILAQLENGYRYNSDTLVLYDFICSVVGEISGRVLDVGAGCGILGLLLKRDFQKIDLSMLDLLELNSKISSFNAKSNCLEARAITADFANFKDSEKFDLIISNPPFYHDGVTKKSK